MELHFLLFPLLKESPGSPEMVPARLLCFWQYIGGSFEFCPTRLLLARTFHFKPHLQGRSWLILCRIFGGSDQMRCKGSPKFAEKQNANITTSHEYLSEYIVFSCNLCLVVNYDLKGPSISSCLELPQDPRIRGQSSKNRMWCSVTAFQTYTFSKFMWETKRP